MAAIYEAHGLDVSTMFRRHLLQFAKCTSEPDGQKVPPLSFHRYLQYLIEHEKKNAGSSSFGGAHSSIGTAIAAYLSAEYYADHADYFSTIGKELFTFWMEHKPEKIIAIIKAVLLQSGPPAPYLNTVPIRGFFSGFFIGLYVVAMPPDFYDKLAVLLINNLVDDVLTSKQFIPVYIEADEECQTRFLYALSQMSRYRLSLYTHAELLKDLLVNMSVAWHTPDYLRSVLILLSHSKRANIDIFEIIEADPDLRVLDAFNNITSCKAIDPAHADYELIFSIVLHYHSLHLLRMEGIATEYILHAIQAGDVNSLHACVAAVQKAAEYLPKAEGQMLLDYVTEEISTRTLLSGETIEMIVSCIPDCEKKLLERLAKLSEGVVKLLDLIIAEGSTAFTQIKNSEKEKDSTALLLTNSWEKSGLLPSSSTGSSSKLEPRESMFPK